MNIYEKITWTATLVWIVAHLALYPEIGISDKLKKLLNVNYVTLLTLPLLMWVLVLGITWLTYMWIKL